MTWSKSGKRISSLMYRDRESESSDHIFQPDGTIYLATTHLRVDPFVQIAQMIYINSA